MERKYLVLCLISLLLLNSCKEDKDELIFFDKPGVEFVLAEREGPFDAVFAVKMQPTKEMYDYAYNRYECGLEYSTDSQFRKSVKVSFGHPDENNTVRATRLYLFPDSAYYIRPILVFYKSNFGSIIGSGNKVLTESDEIICTGSVVTIREEPFCVDDYLTVKIEQVGPMNISCSLVNEKDKMYHDQVHYDKLFIHFSEDSTFSTLIDAYEYRHYDDKAVINVKNLKPSAEYYIRVGFCYNIYKDTGSYFGKTVKVSTSALPKENGKEYVDLGLSVMWAYCNVGATCPEDPGGYYCWGETEELTVNGVRVEDIDFLNNYPTYSKYTPEDGLSTLDSADDVAAVKWGGNWHIPDRSDIEELWANCDNFEEVIVNGKKALKIISRINGNYIYLPIGGWYKNGYFMDLQVWQYAFLWSRNVYGFNSYGMAYCLRSQSSDGYSLSSRSDCLNVRPVFKP